MNEKTFNFRLSNIALKTIRDKAQLCGVSQSKLIRIAVEMVSEEDVLDYLLKRVKDKPLK